MLLRTVVPNSPFETHFMPSQTSKTSQSAIKIPFLIASAQIVIEIPSESLLSLERGTALWVNEKAEHFVIAGGEQRSTRS